MTIGAVGHGRGGRAPEGHRALWRAAATLERRRRQGKTLPVMWMMTDPERLADPVAAAERLPAGSGVILRHFGRPEASQWARALRVVARRRRLVLLIAADPDLAMAVGADGVHAPERQAADLPWLSRRFPIVTAAAHSEAAMRRALRLGADAVLLSAVMPSGSPSAGAPIGVVRFARLARAVPGPVVALGGISERTAARLIDTGAAGFAAVEAFSGR